MGQDDETCDEPVLLGDGPNVNASNKLLVTGSYQEGDTRELYRMQCIQDIMQRYVH